MEGNMMNVAFIPGIIAASDTYDTAAGIGEVCEVSVTHDTPEMSNNPQQRIPVNIKDTSGSSTRIVLLGKSGVGKSAAGNTILGRQEFESELTMDSVTRECSAAHATVSGRSVSVVDTPGFFDTEMKPEMLIKEIARSVYESSPGPHAFLIVFPVNMRFTEQEQQIPQTIEMLFGQEVLKYSIILFTNGDQLKGKSVVNIIERNSRLSRLVDECGGRFHVFNNEDENNREQVNDLLQKIDTMIEQNEGGHYSNQMFKDAHKFRQEEEQRQRKEKERTQEEEKERQEEIERVRKETEERVKAEIEAQQRNHTEKLKQEEWMVKVREERTRPEREHWRKVRKLQKQKRKETEKEKEKKKESSGFLLFLSEYKHHIYMAAIAAGFVVGGAVGGAVVYGAVGGAVGGGVAGAVVGGVETGNVTGAAVGALGGAAVGAAVGGIVVGGAPAASIGTVAKAVGVGVVGGAAVGGASSGTVKGALAGAVVGGAAVGGATMGAALSGAVAGGAAVCGAVAGGAVGGAAVGGAVNKSVAGAVKGGAVVGGAVLAGAVLSGAVVGQATGEDRNTGETVIALAVIGLHHKTQQVRRPHF